MIVLITIIPVIIFLLILLLLDSFKLVRLSVIGFTFASGGTVALISLIISIYLQNSGLDFTYYSKYIAPLVEETLKSLVILFLIKRHRIGFLIDAGIYGFAVGAGFATVENIYYLFSVTDHNILIWILRGIGTSLMHCGITSLFAIIVIGTVNREKEIMYGIFAGIFISVTIHSMYNHFYIQPVIQSLLILITIPTTLIIVFLVNEKQLQKWLEVEFFSEAELLVMIRKGKLLSTKPGMYLSSLKKHFPAEVIIDMYCFIELYLELSIAFKRNLILKEVEMPVIKDESKTDKLKELKHLNKTIGKSGLLALSPLVKINQRNLWKLSSVS